ncbi:hypothetical protein BD289DRAFT_426190 [Coniella lustricola]|uniref:Uncharacterized protein n=1 Tax=Coniella lustricola TaxID=2025994 RepID=A0A2T3AGN7_9PEZI|nr:hypothetical protein BD289DRAFT_426190 [Coniella lustricola]
MKLWKFEALLLSLSIAALVAIVVLLVVEHGTALEAWSFYFSLNTIVSILGTISSTSLASAIASCLAQEKWNWLRKRQDHLYMFDRIDSASRGSRGSFELLAWTKLTHYVSLGALTTVVLLGYDPFIQAIVGSVGQVDLKNVTAAATIGAASKLDVGLLATGGSIRTIAVPGTSNASSICAVSGDSAFSQPDLSIVASIFDGFSNQSSTSTSPRTVSYTCSTGNCSWDVFASMAVCWSCHDVTSRVVASSYSGTTTSEGATASGLLTTFSLPGLNNITNWASVASLSAASKTRRSSVNLIPMIMSARGTINGSQLGSYVNSTTFLLGFSVLNADQGYLNGSVSWNNSHVTATECGLELCTNVYRSVVQEGVLAEIVLGSYKLRNQTTLRPEEGWLEENTTECLDAWDRANANTLLYDNMDAPTDFNVPRTDLQLTLPAAAVADHNLSDTGSPTTFSISDRTLKSTMWWMQSQFAKDDLAWYNESALFAHALGLYPGASESSFWAQTPIAVALTNRSTLAQTFASVADSMTVWMRNYNLRQQQQQQQSGSTGVVVGTTSAWSLHVLVRWPFLAFPLIVTLTGGVFCFMVIRETRRLNLLPLRDSCMAILAYGISDEVRARLQDADDMDNEARKIQVRLADMSKGVMIQECNTDMSMTTRAGHRRVFTTTSNDPLIVDA